MTKITDLTALISASDTDVLPIVDLSGATPTTKKITRANLLGSNGTLVNTSSSQVLTNKDLTSGTNSFPTALVTLTGSQTLTNKVLTSPTINTPTIASPTITSPSFSTIVNTGTLTMPTATDTLVARATTDTLTNKTMSGANNTFTSMPAANLLISSQAAGDLLYASSSSVWARLLLGASGAALFSDGSTPIWATARFKTGAFTRDATAATTTVAYTGVGFKPKAIIFISIIDSSTKWSVGIDDGTSAFAAAGLGSGNMGDSGLNSIYHFTSAGNTQVGKISTFDTDGFTISWTKAGSPSGTIQCYYLALR